MDWVGINKPPDLYKNGGKKKSAVLLWMGTGINEPPDLYMNEGYWGICTRTKGRKNLALFFDPVVGICRWIVTFWPTRPMSSLLLLLLLLSATVKRVTMLLILFQVNLTGVVLMEGCFVVQRLRLQTMPFDDGLELGFFTSMGVTRFAVAARCGFTVQSLGPSSEI